MPHVTAVQPTLLLGPGHMYDTSGANNLPSRALAYPTRTAPAPGGRLRKLPHIGLRGSSGRKAQEGVAVPASKVQGSAALLH